MTYADIFLRVRRHLNDLGSLARWPNDVLLTYAGTVLRRMAEVAPQTSAEVREVALASGSLQTLPAWAVRFLGGVSRSVDGKSIRNVSPEVMDNVLPGWRDDDPDDEITDCVYDQSVPSEFHVYPPALPGTRIKIRAAAKADDPADPTDSVPMNAMNEVALIHGLLAMCFSEDTDVGDLQLAAQHWAQFYESLGVQRQIDAENPPQAKEDKG